MQTEYITASMLYDMVQCPHRVFLDLYGDTSLRDPVSPFVQMLWERGTLHEEEVIDSTGQTYTDLSGLSAEIREKATLDAMERGDPLIYSGRIKADDLMGIPDLLRKTSGGYVAGDIKSGAALENSGDSVEGRPKTRYAVQLALYTDILERTGFSAGRIPFIWDRDRQEVTYDLDTPVHSGKQNTWWDCYQENLMEARKILRNEKQTLTAFSSVCKQCHWYSKCKRQVTDTGDLTLIYRLGRRKRDRMLSRIHTIHELAESDPETFIRGSRTLFPGIGPDTLRLFHERAVLLVRPDTGPYVKTDLSFPEAGKELFYDVETDPFEDICYLHGFVERSPGGSSRERYIAFVAETPTPAAEEKAFKEAWAYIQNARPCALYYYSPYERTTLRKLQERYPSVVTQNGIESLFEDETTIDLLNDIVEKNTEWPTTDHSIKTLATYLGFHWRDTNPSGAASIEWYHRWVETGKDEVKQRILDYNEDDCRAMRVVMEGVKALKRFGEKNQGERV